MVKQKTCVWCFFVRIAWSEFRQNRTEQNRTEQRGLGVLVWLVGKLSSFFSACRCCWGRLGKWCCGDLIHQHQHHHQQQQQLQQDFHWKWHVLTWVNWSSYPVTSWCKFWSFWVQKRLQNWVWFARVWDPLSLITDFGFTSFRPIRLNLLGILSSLLRPPWVLATLFREYYRWSSFFTFSWIHFLCLDGCC